MSSSVEMVAGACRGLRGEMLPSELTKSFGTTGAFCPGERSERCLLLERGVEEWLCWLKTRGFFIPKASRTCLQEAWVF